MKVVNKKLNRSQLVTICLLVASILLLAAYFTVSAIAKNMTSDSTETPNTGSFELQEGESSYLNQPVAYPAIQEKQILLLQIDGPEGKFDISRYPDDQGSFMFHYYVDGEKNSIPYVPPIYSAEGDFSYESLYAIEQNDGYGRIYFLTYLCSAIGSPYFTERIELPKGTDEESVAKRNALLTEYGLTASESTMISFIYGERDNKTGYIVEGSEAVHKIAVGKQAVSGQGYYFMVDDRDCVYYTRSEYFKYALVGFHKFVKGMLVAEGIDSDSTYGPYLTTDFKTWIGEIYSDAEDQIKYKDGFEKPEVVLGATSKTPVVDFEPKDQDFDGYQYSEYDLYTFDLENLKNHPDFKRIESALLGKNVGSYENNEIILTLIKEIYQSSSKVINFGNSGVMVYDYTISAIESVLSDSGERTDGQVSADDSLVKVTYRYTVGGVTSKHDCHAVIDLNTLSAENKAKLVGKSVGALAAPETVTVTYTKYEYTVDKINEVTRADGTKKTAGAILSSDKSANITYTKWFNGESVETNSVDIGIAGTANLSDFKGRLVGQELGDVLKFARVENALAINEKCVVTEIMSIFDEKTMETDVVTDTSYINIAYYREINGVEGTTETTIIRLCDIKDTDRLAPLKTALLGKSKGKLANDGFTVYNTDCYYELMREFTTYEISHIEHYVLNEMIVSFEFYNASNRDPYYGDTFYKNTLENEYRLYGLNADSCQQVVKYFGGIGTDSNSAVGFAGETVAVGLTVKNMVKYGLYAHRIYFELPRGIYDISEGTEGDSSDELSDYAWYSELGFTLYISEATFDENGTRVRYIGSDMYDLIAKVSAEKLDFLEYDFVDFWARRNLLMVDITKVQEINLDFNMEDLNGEYNFNVVFDTYYGGYVNGKYQSSLEPVDGFSPITEQRVSVSTTPNSFNTKIKELMEQSGIGDYKYGLTPLYNKTMGNGEDNAYYPGSYDTLGTAYFNAAYEIILLTRYQGRLTDAEIAEASAKEKIFSIDIKIEGENNYYTYTFHRLDDRRIMVSLSHTYSNGEKLQVSDFYITTFAYKKIVGNYVSLLNGLEVDEELSYPS